MSATAPAKKAAYEGLVKCIGVNGAGAPISREYDLSKPHTEDQVFELFSDHFREETHGKVPRDKFEIKTA